MKQAKAMSRVFLRTFLILAYSMVLACTADSEMGVAMDPLASLAGFEREDPPVVVIAEEVGRRLGGGAKVRFAMWADGLCVFGQGAPSGRRETKSFRIPELEAEAVRRDVETFVRSSELREYAVEEGCSDVVTVRSGETVEVFKTIVACLDPALILTEDGIRYAAGGLELEVSPRIQKMLTARRQIEKLVCLLIVAHESVALPIESISAAR